MTKVSTCPVCQGTKRVQYTGSYASVLAGYSPADQTIPCQNCGGQYQFGTPLGMVRHNVLGKPCTHEYDLAQTASSLRTSICKFCSDTYQIDSGD